MVLCVLLTIGTFWTLAPTARAHGQAAGTSTSPRDISEGDRVADGGGTRWHDEDDDPCSLPREGNLIDWVDETVTRDVCRSARWFDSFFGNARELQDRDSTFGLLGGGTLWDEDDGFDPLFRFRSKLHFPNLDHRLHAIVGHGTSDEIYDEESAGAPPDELFRDEDDWLIGVGLHLSKSHRNRLSLNVGSAFSGGVDPYTRLDYIHQSGIFSDKVHLRFRLTPQWQESKGAGVTSRLSLDKAVGSRNVMRWEASGKTFEDRFDGVSYGTSLQFFHRVASGTALRYVLSLSGQSGFENQPTDIAGSLSLRTAVYRDKLFLETMGGVTFRHRDGEPSREPRWLAGIGLELRFGS